jgi:hypothetical protein
MKQVFATLLFSAIFFASAFAQKPGKEEVNYSNPFQIDSSEYFIIPKIVDGDDQKEYGKGKGFMPWRKLQ